MDYFRSYPGLRGIRGVLHAAGTVTWWYGGLFMGIHRSARFFSGGIKEVEVHFRQGCLLLEG